MTARNEKVDERAPKFLTREWHYRRLIPVRGRERLGALLFREGRRGIGIPALLLRESAPNDNGRDPERDDGQKNTDH